MSPQPNPSEKTKRQPKDFVPKGAKLLWYVSAFKGKTTITLPCWEGEDEADRVILTLADTGWTGPLTHEGDEVVTAEKPIKEHRVVPRSHAHWRENLPVAPGADDE